MNTFTTDMGILRQIYDRNPLNLPKQVWDYIDQLPDQFVFNWIERLLKTQVLKGKDHERVANINFWYREHKSYTKKQKRSIMIDLIRYWYDVEIKYNII